VNYFDAQGAVSSRSVLGGSGAFSPSHSSVSPTPLDEYQRGAQMRGIADEEDDRSFRALSEQSLLGHQLLRSEAARNPDARPGEFSLPLSAFKFDYSHLSKPPRHDSFDSTHSKDYQYGSSALGSAAGGGAAQAASYDASGIKTVFPVNFKLDRAAVMAAFDKGLQKGR
jgi:hypothetical protein